MKNLILGLCFAGCIITQVSAAIDVTVTKPGISITGESVSAEDVLKIQVLTKMSDESAERAVLIEKATKNCEKKSLFQKLFGKNK
jgi:hypothetical protein